MEVELQTIPQVDHHELDNQQQIVNQQVEGQNEISEALTQMSDLAGKFDRDILDLNEELAQARSYLEQIEAEKEAGRREANEQYQEITKLTIEKITRNSWMQRREEHAEWQQAFLDYLEETLTHVIGGSRYSLWADSYVDTFVKTWDHLRDDNVKKAMLKLNERTRELRIQIHKHTRELEEKKKYYELRKQEEERARLAEEKRRQEEEERRKKMEEERILNEKKRQREELLKQVRETESADERPNPFRTISYGNGITPGASPGLSFDQLRTSLPTFGFSSRSYLGSSTTSLSEATNPKEAKPVQKSPSSLFPTFSQLGRF